MSASANLSAKSQQTSFHEELRHKSQIHSALLIFETQHLWLHCWSVTRESKGAWSAAWIWLITDVLACNQAVTETPQDEVIKATHWISTHSSISWMSVLTLHLKHPVRCSLIVCAHSFREHLQFYQKKVRCVGTGLRTQSFIWLNEQSPISPRW